MRKKITNLLLASVLALGLSGVVTINAQAGYDSSIDAFTYEDYYIPAYDGDIYEVVNNNDPLFDDDEMVTTAFENYSELDVFGRCGVAYANICQELMPTEERGEIGSVQPSGWNQEKYDFVDGKYLYNRCHLIGFQLAGENANELNLITGTRALNNDGMLPFENEVADYVEETGNHVLYRVTPIFEEDNLLASGVLMEADSVEDDEIEFCVFVYNVQDGVSIDYATGKSKLTADIYDEQYNISNADITLSYTSTTYTAVYKKPAVTVVMNGNELEKDVDYTLKYSKNKNAGTGLVKITGIGTYTGEATRSFKINARKITASGVEISTVSKKAYTGKQIKPSPTITYKDKELVKGTDYTITYGTNKNTGKGTLTIKGKGNFQDSKQITFKIVPKKPTISNTSSKKKSITAKWNKPTGTTGFQVAYRKKGSDTWKYKLTKNKSITISSLASGTNYQFKVRAYKLVGESKYYGNWSTTKTIKTTGKASNTSGSGTATTNQVWISETGSKYHKVNDCGRMNPDKAQKVTKSKAESMGLEPCDKCF